MATSSLFDSSLGMQGNFVPGGSNPGGGATSTANAWNPVPAAPSTTTPGGQLDIMSIFNPSATPGQSGLGLSSGGWGEASFTSGINPGNQQPITQIQPFQNPSQLLNWLMSYQNPAPWNPNNISNLQFGPLGGQQSTFDINTAIQQLQQMLGSGAPPAPNMPSNTGITSAGGPGGPPVSGPFNVGPAQPGPISANLDRLSPVVGDGSFNPPYTPGGVPSISAPPSRTQYPGMPTVGTGGITSVGGVGGPPVTGPLSIGTGTTGSPTDPNTIINQILTSLGLPGVGTTGATGTTPFAPTSTTGTTGAPNFFGLTGPTGGLNNLNVASLLGGANVTQLSGQLDNIFGKGVGTLVTNYLQQGAGFNPAVATALTNAFAPYEQTGVASILEAFGGAGMRDSSSAALGLGNFERDLALGKDAIFAQQYQNAVSNYTGMLDQVLQSAAAAEANKLGPLDWLNALMPLLSKLIPNFANATGNIVNVYGGGGSGGPGVTIGGGGGTGYPGGSTPPTFPPTSKTPPAPPGTSTSTINLPGGSPNLGSLIGATFGSQGLNPQQQQAIEGWWGGLDPSMQQWLTDNPSMFAILNPERSIDTTTTDFSGATLGGLPGGNLPGMTDQQFQDLLNSLMPSAGSSILPPGVADPNNPPDLSFGGGSGDITDPNAFDWNTFFGGSGGSDIFGGGGSSTGEDAGFGGDMWPAIIGI